MSACPTCGAAVTAWSATCPVCGAAARTAAVSSESDARAEVRERLAAAARGEYEVVGDIGRGGMGWVFLGRDLKLGRQAALKVLPPIDAMRAASLERFRREAETAARLTHPNIVTIYGAGGDLATPYFAMAYIEGETLAARLERDGPLPVEEAVRIAREVGSALAYAHRQGVVHRDIKPMNVLLEREAGRALVADFGVARGRGDGLTQSGYAVGTPGYMAPEQASGAPDVDARADQYALGVLLFEMLTGRRHDTLGGGDFPVSSSSVRRALTASRPDLPAGLAAAVVRATDPRRDNRFPDVHAMLAAVVAPATRPEARRARAVWLVLAAVAVLGVGRLAWTALRGGAPPPLAPAGTAIAILRFEGDSAGADSLLEPLVYELRGFATVRVADPRVFAPPRGADLADPAVRLLAQRAGAAWILYGRVGPGGERRVVSVLALDVASGRVHDLGRSRVESADVAAADSVLLLLARSDIGRSLGLSPGGVRGVASLEAMRAFNAAEDAFRRADYAAAVREYGRVAQLDPAFALARYKRFLAVLQEEPTEAKLREAVAEMRRVVPEVGPLEQRLLRAYLVLFDSGDVVRAERQMRDLVAADTTFLDGWFALAELRYHFGALAGLPPDSAAAAFRRALALWPDAAPAVMHLIALDLHSGREEQARVRMDEYLALDSTSAVGQTVALGRTVLFGSPAERLAVPARLGTLNERVLEFGAFNSAQVMRDRADNVMARQALEEMTRPGRSPVLRSEGARFLVLSYLAEGRWSDAEREWERLSRLLPGDRELALVPGIIRELRNPPRPPADTARAMARDAALLDSLDAPHVPFGLEASRWLPRWRLARFTVAQGDTAGALALLEAQGFLSAFADQVVRGPAWLLRGRILAASGDTAGAERLFRRSADLLHYAEPPWDAVRDSARLELERLGVSP